MTIQECYQRLGGIPSDGIRRLIDLGLIQKYIAKFLEDDNFEKLCKSTRLGRCEEAFRAAHTLTGLCQTLGFETLLRSAAQITELLRSAGDTIPPQTEVLLDAVKRDYTATVTVISMYLNDKNAQSS